MSKLVINGGKTLEGSIKISSSKDSALSLIAASILIKETRLTNVPKIKDIENMLEIISFLGGQYKWLGAGSLIINTEKLESKPLPETARKFRASILLAGPLLARFNEVELPYPGGDIIGARPLDTHINALAGLGVELIKNENLHLKVVSKSSGAKLVLEESSVTATENILLLAAGIDYAVEVRLAATEPHVQDLCNFLIKAGVDISGISATTLKIKGKDIPLNNVSHMVLGDELEVSAFAVLAAATHSQLTL